MAESPESLNRTLLHIYPLLEELAERAARHTAPGGGKAMGRGGAGGRGEAAGQALKALQRGLTGERSLAGRDYFADPGFLAAYLLYYWPVSFVQTWLCLEEMEARGMPVAEPRVLDLGAGPGPASLAALLRGGGGSSVLVDANPRALEAACGLAARMDLSVEARRANLEQDCDLPPGPYDLVLACHSVNEVWKGKPDALDRRADLLRRAAAELNDGGMLLIVEPSAAITAIPALELRDTLLAEDAAEGPATAGEAGVSRLYACAAPCPGSEPCPAIAAGDGRSCHSTWSWKPIPGVAALAAAAGLDRDSVKATWFALRKGGREESGGRGPSEASTEAAAKAERGCIRGRVVSEQLINKGGRARYLVCEGSRLATVSAPLAAPWARAAGFLSLRRGDLVEFQELEPRPGERSFGFEQGSRLRLRYNAPEAES